MKKLLFSSLTALTMLFSFVGMAKADTGDAATTAKAKVKVELSPATFKSGATENLPEFTVSITQAPAETGGESVDPQAENDIVLGTAEGNVAVKVSFKKGETEKTQVLTSTPVDLAITDLTEGEWTLAYVLVKGNENTADFEGDAEMDDASTDKLTVEAAAPAETKPDTVTVTLSTDKWEMGKQMRPTVNVQIKNVAPSTLKIGKTESDVAVLVTFTKGEETPIKRIFTGSASLLAAQTDSMTVGDYAITYQLVKGNSTDASVTNIEASVAVVSAGSASKFTVEQGTVATPTFTKEEGAVDEGTEVRIKTSTNGAKIYYTTNGDAPTESSTEYTTPVVVNQAMTIKAIAVKEGWKNSAVAEAAYTIAELPADAEDAPAITLSPAPADSVDNNTEIFITAPAGYKVYYISFSSISEAAEFVEMLPHLPSSALAYYMQAYGTNIPTVTDEAPILGIVLVGDDTYTYCRRYKVRKGSDVEMPYFMTEFGARSGVVDKGTELNIVQDEELDIWYTTDGSTPAVNGATSTKGEGIAKIKIDSSMTVKAIAVTEDGETSDVAVARFKIFEDVEATLAIDGNMVVMKGDTVGKNIALPFSIESADLGNELQDLLYEHPFTVYYTTDGKTEPSEDEYYELKAKDSANNPIKMAAMETDEYGDIIMPSVLLSESPVTLKAKGYLMLGETSEEGMLVTATLTKTFVLKEEQRPEFSISSGSEIKAGDTLTVKNPGTEELASTMYFSFDGTQPSQDAYFAIDWNGVYNIFKTNEGEDLKIIFGKDAKGMYAHVPAIYELLYKQDTIRFEEEFSVEVICYSAIETGNYNMMGRPEMFQYASDFVKAGYTVMNDLPKPVITPNGGAVAKGTKVEIASTHPGAQIYYSINADTVTANSALYVAADGIIIDKDSITVRAIAVKKTEGKADSVSNIAEAFFTLMDTVKAPVITPNGGEVEKGTKVTVACATEGAIVRYTTDGSEPTATSNEYDAETGIVINEALTLKVMAVKEGMINSQVVSAEFTVKAAPIVEKDTLPMPKFSVAAGEVKEGTKVALSCDTASAKIYYTVDGSVPTEKSTEYKGEITIDKAMTIKAIAVKEGFVSSKVAEAAYTIETANEGRELAGVRLYPNPTDGNFSVEAPVAAKVEIFSANGVIVKSFTMAAGVEEVRLNNSGIYFVRLTAENGQAAVKRVIVR
ncbi:MAG: chitobiase/beta-hexosaminidase C-terminal domain-containing protein [Bacteroides sp.]|nr:chitobiase/beta-hexosaminidase C-terminal domain-containing protein [Ruminococcus flavefaciens]MCM1555287.1 chitobiase/beta-hexosaminidase C-terminal domain-containing protein [Bacteroides sp.]